jgi:hypothetical protein
MVAVVAEDEVAAAVAHAAAGAVVHIEVAEVVADIEAVAVERDVLRRCRGLRAALAVDAHRRCLGLAVVAAHDLVAAEAAVRGRILRAEALVVRDPAVALAARGPVAVAVVK